MVKLNIKNPSNPNISTAPDNMMHGKDYAFYLHDDINNNAPTYYSKLISKAKNNIIIWDPYFYNDDTKIFSDLQCPVDVYVLTKKYAKKKDSYLNDLISGTSKHINLLVKGQCYFFFGFIDTDRHGDLWQCHDRFLIIDNSRFFLIGSSVASHLSPKHSTGIYEVKKQKDRRIIINAFNKTMSICIGDTMYIEKNI